MARLMRRFLVVAAVLLAGAAAQGQTPVRQTLPVPDLPGFRTLKGDFHLHTVFSDGNVWPTVHVQEAWRDGLDVIALTEHAEYHPHIADVKVDGGRSYAIAKPLADRAGRDPRPGGRDHQARSAGAAGACGGPAALQRAVRHRRERPERAERPDGSAPPRESAAGVRVLGSPGLPRGAPAMVRADRARVRGGSLPGHGARERPGLLRRCLPVDCRAAAHDPRQQRCARSHSASRRRLPASDHAALRADGRSRRRARRADVTADSGVAARRCVGRGRTSPRDLERRDRDRHPDAREESDPARAEHARRSRCASPCGGRRSG